MPQRLVGVDAVQTERLLVGMYQLYLASRSSGLQFLQPGSAQINAKYVTAYADRP